METVRLYCLCGHEWDIQAPVVDGTVEIGMFDDLCPLCQAQGTPDKAQQFAEKLEAGSIDTGDSNQNGG